MNLSLAKLPQHLLGKGRRLEGQQHKRNEHKRELTYKKLIFKVIGLGFLLKRRSQGSHLHSSLLFSSLLFSSLLFSSLLFPLLPFLFSFLFFSLPHLLPFFFLISYFLSLISYFLFLISYFCCDYFERIPSHTPTPPLPYHTHCKCCFVVFSSSFFPFSIKNKGGEVVYLGFGCFSSSVGGFLCFFEMTISGLGRRTPFRPPGGEEAQEEGEHHQGQEERQKEGVGYLCVFFFPFNFNIFFRFFLPLCFPFFI